MAIDGETFVALEECRGIQKLYNTLKNNFSLLDYSEKFYCLLENSIKRGYSRIQIVMIFQRKIPPIWILAYHLLGADTPS